MWFTNNIKYTSDKKFIELYACQKLSKKVSIWKSYGKNKTVQFFFPHSVESQHNITKKTTTISSYLYEVFDRDVGKSLTVEHITKTEILWCSTIIPYIVPSAAVHALDHVPPSAMSTILAFSLTRHVHMRSDVQSPTHSVFQTLIMLCLDCGNAKLAVTRLSFFHRRYSRW